MALSTVWLNKWKREVTNIFPKLVHLELGLHLRNIDDLARPQVIMWRATLRPMTRCHDQVLPTTPTQDRADIWLADTPGARVRT
jgi:hypothetical protein